MLAVPFHFVLLSCFMRIMLLFSVFRPIRVFICSMTVYILILYYSIRRYNIAYVYVLLHLYSHLMFFIYFLQIAFHRCLVLCVF